MDKPDWYISPSDYAGLIIDALEDNHFFKRNERVHPEDLHNAFEPVALSIALALAFVGRSTKNQSAKEIKKRIKDALNQEDFDGVNKYTSDLYDTWKSTD